MFTSVHRFTCVTDYLTYVFRSVCNPHFYLTFVSVLLTQSVLLQSAITETAVTGPLSLTIVQSDLKMCSPVLART